MAPRTLNVCLVGAGFMGKAHSLAYATMPMYFWPAPAMPVRKVICEATQALADDAALRFGFERASDDWRSAVQSPDVDVVDIATPNNLHAEVAIAAAQAGKHVISEKPLALDAAEAKQMVDAVEQAGVVNMVAFNYRRTPAVQQAKKMIEAGEIGEILNFRGQYLQEWSANPEMPLSWRFKKATSGSGALGDIGTHALDLARYLVGDVAAVSALLKTHVAERPLPQGGPQVGRDNLGATRGSDTQRGAVEVDDEVVTLLRFANGAIGSLEATRNAYGRYNYLTFEIHGSKGSIAFNYEHLNELQVVLASDRPDLRGYRTIVTGPAHPVGQAMWPIPGLAIGYSELKIIECHDLFKAIVDGTEVRPNFRDGYQIALITDAIIQSDASHSWVEIPAGTAAR